MALILQPPSSLGPQLPPGAEAAQPAAALTALRALRQLGATDDLPRGATGLVEEVLLQAGEPDAPWVHAVSDFVAAQDLGAATAIELPQRTRDSLAEQVVTLLALGVTDDPSAASDRLVVVRAARDAESAPPMPSQAETGWCSRADAAIGAGRVDVAAVFAEMASSASTFCPLKIGDLDRWRAVVTTAAHDQGTDIGSLAFLAPLLSDSDRAGYSALVLADLDKEAASGAIFPLRVYELVSRLAGPKTDLARYPEVVRVLRRQVLLVGSPPDMLVPTDWNRVISRYVAADVGMVDVSNTASDAASGATDYQPGVVAALGLSSGSVSGLPPASALPDDVVKRPWVVAAMAARTGDCDYAAAINEGSVPETIGDGIALLQSSLVASQLRRCTGQAAMPSGRVAAIEGLASKTITDYLSAAHRSPQDASGGTSLTSQVVDVWGAAESACVLGKSTSPEDRAVFDKLASEYIATFTGAGAFASYSPEGLYGALRLRHLAGGCDGRGWWNGLSP